jgi:type III restriction enzyme
MGVRSLRHGASVFYDDNSQKYSEPDDAKLLKDLIADETLAKAATIEIQNAYLFKTPLNIVLASHDPERRFVRALTQEENAKVIDGWIKSADIGFYSIEYSWRKGEHPKQGRFNPDYFIKKGSDVVVIEIKMDDDVTVENRAKLRYAREHFKRLNELQKDVHYEFKMVSPSSYDTFFQAIRDGGHRDFKSNLEAALE